MSDSATIPPRVPLGAGQIISESFSLLFGNIVAVAVAAFIPILFALAISGSLMGFDIMFGTAEPDVLAQGFAGVMIGTTLLSLAIYGIVTAIIVQLAYDAKSGRGTNFGKYASTAVQTLVPNVILTLVISILAGFGMIALIIPGIWIYGVFAVTIPVLVIERVGFGSMGRSAELTKEYRWPVIGTIIVIGIAAGILNLIPTFIVQWLLGSLGSGSIAFLVVLSALLQTLSYGLVSIGLALIYARLREIKDGVGIEDLVGVFE
ncbi:hypothetical protein [Amylibacter sp. IMCC11727]|uniref:hypothetical protein n=1 Tax=Amylibacter sp. IMCC11727 TaxID=3039851 RepID=UPI00244E05AF|nr:hypothetical protein [Amylibacter sp. IMCC11727]WGI21255.1 hypothetical protein QBD29_14210 [Amylibacter sp. IMCC11727]